jgi:hypothetical protein
MIPGNNLLMVAMGAINQQPVQYIKALGRTENDAGYLITDYAPPVPVHHSSVQAVPRSLYSQLGLDLQKRYVRWFVSANVVDVSRGAAGDNILYGGRRYSVESITEWFSQDGWCECLCVEVLNA